MISSQRGRACVSGLRDRILAATGRLREVAKRFGVNMVKHDVYQIASGRISILKI